MSSIIEKAFDASKKIVRSIFQGTPNLITSSDLNRQIEALKYQVDSLDSKVGGMSDVEITPILSGSTLRVSVEYSYMEFRGCAFSPSKTVNGTINLTDSAPTVYVLLTATERTLTYSDDSSHEIAGAKFQDGSSYPAADQIIYENEQIVLSHSVSEVQNVVGVIAVVSLVNGKAVVNKNTVEKGQSLPIILRGSVSPVEFYKVANINYDSGSFYFPDYFKFSVGDIIELCVPLATTSVPDEGYVYIDVKIRVTSTTENSGSGWFVVTAGETTDAQAPKIYNLQALFNPILRSVVLVSSEVRISNADSAYFSVVKGSMLV